jgi:hypothetical protein
MYNSPNRQQCKLEDIQLLHTPSVRLTGCLQPFKFQFKVFVLFCLLYREPGIVEMGKEIDSSSREVH